MAYIGNIPAEKYQTLQKQSFTTSATDTYTLSYSVTNPQDLALFINNVRQNPNDAYTVSGTTLTLSSAITSSDTMYAVFLGRAVETIAPATGSVTNAMLAGSIATSKLADGSTFATTNGITVVDQWYMDTSFSGNGDITSNWTSTMPYTGYGVIGSAVTESSGIFTFPSTGIWKVSHDTNVQFDAGDFIIQIIYNFSTDSGSSYDAQDAPLVGLGSVTTLTRMQHSFSAIYDVTNASTTRFKMSTSSISADSTIGAIFLTFTRLGDT